jgi:hypothetical protein
MAAFFPPGGAFDFKAEAGLELLDDLSADAGLEVDAEAAVLSADKGLEVDVALRAERLRSPVI